MTANRELKILVIVNQVLQAIEGCQGLLELSPMAPQLARNHMNHILPHASDELIDEAYVAYTSPEWASYLSVARKAQTIADLEEISSLADSIAPTMTARFHELAEQVIAEHGLPAGV
jgi:hypothetical protein